MIGEQATIRELLSGAWPDIEAVLDLSDDERVRRACFRLEKRFIDALALMDEADKTFAVGERKYIGDLSEADQRLVPDAIRYRLIPDPGAGSSLPGATTTKEHDYPCPQCDYAIPGASCSCPEAGRS